MYTSKREILWLYRDGIKGRSGVVHNVCMVHKDSLCMHG